MYRISSEAESEVLGNKLESEWNKELQKRQKASKVGASYNPSLTKAIVRAFLPGFLIWGILAFFAEIGFDQIAVFLLKMGWKIGPVFIQFEKEYIYIYIYRERNAAADNEAAAALLRGASEMPGLSTSSPAAGLGLDYLGILGRRRP